MLPLFWNIIKVKNSHIVTVKAWRKKVKFILDLMFFRKTKIPRKKTKIELTSGNNELIGIIKNQFSYL